MRRTALLSIIITGMIAILFPASLNILSRPGPPEQDISTTTLYCVLEDPWKVTHEEKDKGIQVNTQDAAVKNLAPGEYFLRVQGAGSENKLKKKGTLVRIIVIPQFWKTWWFKMGTFLLVVGILFSLYKIRMRFLLLEGNSQAKLGYFFSKHNISKREEEITLLLLQGESKKSIEDKLFISSHTVKNHIYNIYRKLGIKNRLQLFNLFKVCNRPPKTHTEPGLRLRRTFKNSG
jgi:DNA-binding CsgD family transcriptional regulator